MNNMFIFTDSTKCIGCLNCELACASSHMNMSLDEALESGKKLISRNKVIKVKDITAPIQCMHCQNPACLNVCPHDAIRQEGHFVHIHEDKCVGCGCCSLVCPYGAIKMIEESHYESNINNQLAIKCDLCFDKEEGSACIEHCPTDAICLIDYKQYSSIMLEKEQLL